MNLKEAAIKYHSLNLSVIPIGNDKIPIGTWKKNITERIYPDGGFDSGGLKGIGICCGQVSNDLTCIDIDCKYDLTGKLFLNYKNIIHEQDEKLLAKLVVEETPTRGYHFFYLCKKLFGNLKLANRYATIEEITKEPDVKVKVLIETRGVGGYVQVAPTLNYKFIYKNFEYLQEITDEEQKTLFDCAKTFNEVYEKPIIKKEVQQFISDNLSPFEDWNQRGDILTFLEKSGWKVTLQRGDKNLLLRPGGKGKWSADFDSKRRLLYVWTTSSEFENDKAYNPIQVLAILKFNSDYSQTAKWLISQGYGQKLQRNIPKSTIENNFDFISTENEDEEYLQAVRNGTFKMGLETGIPELDKYFRFKTSNLVIINGTDNVGKSTIIWYLAVLSAIQHQWRWIIFSAENKIGGIRRKLIEFFCCEELKYISENRFLEAKNFTKKYFTLIKNEELYNYSDMLEIGKKLCEKEKYNAFMIDPYNSLSKENKGSEHEYDYTAISQFRLFVQKTKCCIYLTCHSQTEAVRRNYTKEHIYFGYPMPPGKGDTEGGAKFSNKADIFITCHRFVQHPTEWMNMQLHVRKIRETETGGRPTELEKPVILKMLAGGKGFETIDGFNPITKKQNVQQIINYTEPQEVWMDTKEDKPF